ncbi:MAG: ferrous iron transport protein B [Verrucomicrobia bacterium]|nr:ferrous iron transport protein B [Verrucomicrobiota bacterium]
MKPFTVVLTGNPNCGKTTLFNALTGLRGRVGNYAGVTVERKEGSLTGADARFPVTILDLPGTYSLSPQSPDEQIARDILFQRVADVPAPDLVVVVVDASNLQRNLYFATQVIELGHPTLLTLNMVDVARDRGHDIDTDALSKALGVPVIPMVASQGEGLEPLRQSIRSQASSPGTRHVIPREFNELPEAFGREAQAIETALERHFPHRSRLAAAEALLLLSDERALPTDKTNTDGNTNGNTANTRYPSALIEQVLSARRRLEAAGVDWRSTAIEARYARLFAIEQHVTRETPPPDELLSDRIDRVVTHRVWGPLIFVTVMALMFQSIFWLAQYPMSGIEAAVDALAQWVGSSMPPGDLNDLITRGAIAGVGSVVIFLPQICLLFLFIGLLEDTGYMSRAAFLMDRLMSRVGLHGKSFIPMLSSFACAIPGIMATRTIETRQDRLATILVAPLMSCSARLPVYTVLIAACIPQRNGWPGLTLLMMYLLGIAGALGMAWIFKKTLLRGEPPMLILELPPYKRPMLGAVLRQMWDRSKLFLKRAGTVILGINILLWFLATYPRSSELQQEFDQRHAQWKQAASNPPTSAESETLKRLDQEEAGEKLRQSFAGRLGRAIEPALKPLGFDWKIGIGIVTSFAAREVFVSTLSVVYNVGGDSENTASLAEVMKSERRDDGRKTYTPLTGLTLMVFYVFAMQCVSTVAVVRRETNSWKWPLFQTVYMTSLAWILAFLTYQVGTRLGF